MNDSNFETLNNQAPDSPQNGEKKDSSRKSCKGGLNSELKSALSNALGSWDDISPACPPVATPPTASKPSPASERMEEFKQILGELKTKLQQFE